MTLDEVSAVLVDYTEAARETGFTPQSNAVEGALIKYMSFSDETGMADLALYVVDGAKELAGGGVGTLWFALAVPDAMSIKIARSSGGARSGCEDDGAIAVRLLAASGTDSFRWTICGTEFNVFVSALNCQWIA